jgi:hypothetical protein
MLRRRRQTAPAAQATTPEAPPLDVDELAANSYPTEQRQRCVSCGFLSRFDIGGDSQLHDVGAWTRANGDFRGSIPACFRQKADLFREMREEQQKRTEDGAYTHPTVAGGLVLNLERNCDRWYPFQPGLSPKDHLDQMLMIQIEQARRAHEREMVRLQIQAQETGVRIADATKRLTRYGVVVAVILLVLAVASLVATVYYGSRPLEVHVHVTAPTATPTR